MLAQTFKIVLSPFNPNMEVVGPFVFTVHPPYGDKSVTLVINPNLQHYEEKADAPEGVDVRQVTVSQNTDETRKLNFDINTEPEQVFDFRGGKYKVKLLSIAKENIEGQDFLSFEFFLEEQ
jgi:hypothetical protein